MKKVKNKFLTVLAALLAYGTVQAQDLNVSGRVVDASGEPVVGASVVVKGTTTGATTGINGDYDIAAPSDATLTFSFLGLGALDVAVNGRARLDVRLAESDHELQEVVVTALGISREKKALGYAVAEVKGDEMLKSRGGVSNPINSLQGKVAGLQIASASGQMGGSSKITIRGAKSISGNNQPLFVVDGVPIEGTDFNSTAEARGAGGYDYGNLIQDINPDDIENISVLKGVNASALYGSRATNGVVMITTKKGKRGDGYGVTFSSSVGFETINKLPKLQKLYGGGFGDEFEKITINGKTYLYPDMATDESWGPRYEGQEIVSWYDLAKWEANGKVGDPTTSKWQTPANDYETYFKTGVSLTNSVAITQATDRAAARFSYTNTNQTGYMPNSELQKNAFNLSANVNSPDKRLEVFTNVNYVNTAAKGRAENGYGDNNVMVRFLQWGHRELDVKELKDMWKYSDGTQAVWNRKAWDAPSPAYHDNFDWLRYMNYQNDTRNRVYGNAGFSVNILPSLKFSYKANLDFFVDKQYERVAVYSFNESNYMEISRQQYELNNEFMLAFNKQVGDFSLSANLGGNLMQQKYEYVYGESVGGLSIPEFYNLKNSLSLARGYNTMRQKAINSVFASGTLGWRNMAYLDASLRNDWSSTLPKNNNSYLYPAVTGSFIFSEPLKAAASWLSFGKVRVGYARVGSDTDPYRIVDTYEWQQVMTSTPGYLTNSQLNNPDLKPEQTTSLEVGLEASFLNSRVGFDLTLYQTKTKDEIIPMTVSGSTGYYTQIINAGLMSNTGVEARVYGTPVKVGDFSWETSLTLASNKNKLEKLFDNGEDGDYLRIINAPFNVEIGAIEGKEYGIIMGKDFLYDNNGNKVIQHKISSDGVWSNTGEYATTDGNVPLANIYPDFTGGWSNTFKYKNFELGVLFDFSKGGHFYSTSYQFGMYSGMFEESVALNENGKNIRDDPDEGGGVLLQGVVKNAEGNYVPNDKRIDAATYGSGFYNGPGRQNIFKTDYLKLREVTLGYTFTMKPSWFVKNLRLAAYGRNLKVWGPDVKHFDPESVVTNSGNIQGIEGGLLPSVANYGFTLTLKF